MKKNCLLTLIIALVTPMLFGAARARLATAPCATAAVATATSVNAAWSRLVDTYLRKILKPKVDTLHPGGHSPEYNALSIALTALLNNETRHARGTTKLSHAQIQRDCATVKLLQAALEGAEGVLARIVKSDKTTQCTIIKRCLDECTKPGVQEAFNDLDGNAEQQKAFRGFIDKIVSAPLTTSADEAAPTAARTTPRGGCAAAAAAAAAAAEPRAELPPAPETETTPASSGAEADAAALFESFS